GVPRSPGLVASSGSVRRDRRTPCPPAASDGVIDAPRARGQSVGVRWAVDTLLCCVLRIDLPTREQTNGARAPRECDPAPVSASSADDLSAPAQRAKTD